MPRPLRIREKEGQIAADPALDAGVQKVIARGIPNTDVSPQAHPIDPQPEAATMQLNGAGEADESPIRRVAKQLGWKTREESDLDPERFEDEEAFLSRTTAEVAALKEHNRNLHERLRRQGQVAAELADQAALRAREELAAEIRRKAEAGDTQGVTEATQRLIQATPDGRVEAWVTKNPWFRTDPKAEMVARASAEEAKRMGASIEAQLEAAEAEVRKRFPEHFGQDDHIRTNGNGEVRLSDRRAPVVEGGTRAAAPLRSRTKTWNDIPGQDRHQMSASSPNRPSQLAMFTRKFGDENKAKIAMAQSYWREQGEAQ